MRENKRAEEVDWVIHLGLDMEARRKERVERAVVDRKDIRGIDFGEAMDRGI